MLVATTRKIGLLLLPIQLLLPQVRPAFFLPMPDFATIVALPFFFLPDPLYVSPPSSPTTGLPSNLPFPSRQRTNYLRAAVDARPLLFSEEEVAGGVGGIIEFIMIPHTEHDR